MTALFVLAVLVLVAVNGFFVAAEFALVRARKSKIEEEAEEGVRGAAMALREIERIDEYLSACQLGITMASIGIGFLGEKAIGEELTPLIGAAGGIVLAYVATTAAHITAGEQVPKIFSIVHAERVARLVARPLHWFYVAFKPANWLLNRASNAMLRLVGVDPRAEFEESAGSEDVRMLVARGFRGGTLEPSEAVMLSGVLHLHEQQARQIMTPFPAVVTVDAAETVKDGLERCIESGHTRLVVTEDQNADRIRGFVHSNTLVRMLMSDGDDTPIEKAVKDVMIVPETKPLDDLLADLQRERMSLSVVVDEYGRTAGIVTIEDIVEEVVGEISDETDPAGGAVRQLSNGDWYVRGHVPINDLDDYGIHLPVESDAFNSVGGYVFAELGRLPKRGDTVRADGYSLRVESVRENRVEGVRIRDHGPDRQPDPLTERERREEYERDVEENGGEGRVPDEEGGDESADDGAAEERTTEAAGSADGEPPDRRGSAEPDREQVADREQQQAEREQRAIEQP
jgi:CBS domain containing-hemolysin-like protein